MKFMIRLGVVFYVTMILILTCVALLLVLNAVPFDLIVKLLELAYYDFNIRLAVGAVAVAILLINHLFSRAILSEQQRGKIIAFDNPSGRVSVSLSALEDLVRKEIFMIREVKETKIKIAVGRRGLDVAARLVLNTDVNIPEMTSSLQELVKKKIQDTIGIDETVTVRVHVMKIVPEGRKTKSPKVTEEAEAKADAPNVPFPGYRA